MIFCLFIYLVWVKNKNRNIFLLISSFIYPWHFLKEISSLSLSRAHWKVLGHTIISVVPVFHLFFILATLWYHLFNLQNAPVFSGNSIIIMRILNMHLPSFPYNNLNSLNIPNPVNHSWFECYHWLSLPRQVSRRQHDRDFNSSQSKKKVKMLEVCSWLLHLSLQQGRYYFRRGKWVPECSVYKMTVLHWSVTTWHKLYFLFCSASHLRCLDPFRSVLMQSHT